MGKNQDPGSEINILDPQHSITASRVVDPHHVDAVPDSTYHPDADPDSDFYLMRMRMRIQIRIFT
jgi:hypothetical protein